MPGDPDYFVFRQSVNIAIGVIVLCGRRAPRPRRSTAGSACRSTRSSLVALAAIFVADPVRGTRRWIDIGFFRFQPSELGKVVLILMLAGFVADRARRIDEWGTTFGAVGLAAAPAVLVFLEPDFGTAMVYAAIVAAVLFIAGTRWLHIGGARRRHGAHADVDALDPAGGRRADPPPVPGGAPDRLLEPGLRPERATYNITQSITAVGSGGLDGRGVAGATQTNMNYLPEHSTDFIFSSLAEQRGFLGRGAPPAPLRDRRLARASARSRSRRASTPPRSPPAASSRSSSRCS